MDEIARVRVARLFGDAPQIARPGWDNCAFTRRPVSQIEFRLMLMSVEDEVALLFQPLLDAVPVELSQPGKWMVQHRESNVGALDGGQRIVNLRLADGQAGQGGYLAFSTSVWPPPARW